MLPSLDDRPLDERSNSRACGCRPRARRCWSHPARTKRRTIRGVASCRARRLPQPCPSQPLQRCERHSPSRHCRECWSGRFDGGLRKHAYMHFVRAYESQAIVRCIGRLIFPRLFPLAQPLPFSSATSGSIPRLVVSTETSSPVRPSVRLARAHINTPTLVPQSILSMILRTCFASLVLWRDRLFMLLYGYWQ